MIDTDLVDYTAPPTLAAMMKSDAYGRIIAGPVGSGKTTGCLMEVFRRSCEQAKAADGYRYTRWAFVRITLKQLKDTVLKEIQNWLGRLGEWKVSENTFHLEFSDVRSEWIFIPLEDAQDQARLLSMQLTGVWLNEIIEMNFDILAPVSGRVGRYPSGNHGTPSWFGIIGDTNMPVELSDWHKFMVEPPGDWQIFRQPSGMAPAAENLEHLLQNENTKLLHESDPRRIEQGRKYYQRFLDMYGSESDWCRRYVHAEYGNDPSGEAVFRQTFKTSWHTVDDTLIIPGYPLIVGQDFGRNPWSVIAQLDHMGRLLVHEEVGATNIGLEKHVTEALKPRLFSSKFIGARAIVVGDPSGVARGTIAEESCFDALRRLGLSAYPAPSNDIDARLRSVEALLVRAVNAGPALCISRRGCPWLVRAMAGGYRFSRAKQGGLRPVPEKLDKEGFSHVADALQYVALVVHGNMVQELVRRSVPRKPPPPQQRVTAAGWT